MSESQNHRRLERISIEQPVVASNALNGEVFGQLVNMHEDGFMVLSSGQIKEHHLYQVRLSHADTPSEDTCIFLGAECLWIRGCDSGSLMWAGFMIVDISNEHLTRVKSLIYTT